MLLLRLAQFITRKKKSHLIRFAFAKKKDGYIKKNPNKIKYPKAFFSNIKFHI